MFLFLFFCFITISRLGILLTQQQAHNVSLSQLSSQKQKQNLKPPPLTKQQSAKSKQKPTKGNKQQPEVIKEFPRSEWDNVGREMREMTDTEIMWKTNSEAGPFSSYPEKAGLVPRAMVEKCTSMIISRQRQQQCRASCTGRDHRRSAEDS